MSPHIQHSSLVADVGMPQMIKPFYATLEQDRPLHTWFFVADEDLEFQVKQEADSPDEPLAFVKIKRRSPWVEKILNRFTFLLRK